ncbi:MAG: transglycosylase domain-containing protein, partial [Rhodospirillales bacterium]
MGKTRKNKTNRRQAARRGKAHRPRGGILSRLWRAVRWTAGRALKWGTVAAVWGVIAFTALAAWYGTELPDVDAAFEASRRPTVTVLAADGSEIVTTGDVYGALTRLKDLPPALIDAVLATEDRRFYDHFGLDIIGLLRAVAANVRARRIIQGGSTITQQVAKNLFLTPDR